MMNLSEGLSRLFRKYPSKKLIANDHSIKELLDDGVLCSRIDDMQKKNCWTVSLYAALIDCGKEELIKLDFWQALPLKIMLFFFSGILKLGKIDKQVGINNFALSTNLFSSTFKQKNFYDLTRKSKELYPQHALIIRSLNVVHHRELMQKLEKENWHFLVNRQIYLIEDPEKALQRRDSKRDLKLLEDGHYYFRQLSPESSERDFLAVKNFYEQLYLGKYSKQNVQFTPIFFKELVAEGLLDLFLLERVEDRQAVACLGMIVEEGILTTPIFGYDLSLPQEEALYRRLSVFITRYCLERGYRQHLSSGASDFKKSRGAVAELEYMAVYYAHLPIYRRLIWSILEKLSQGLYKNILVKNGL